MNLIRNLFAFLLTGSTLLAATGSWNGVSFTAWNGVAITAWNGTSISTAGSTLLFSDGFESGDTSAWTAEVDSNSILAVQSSVKHSGTYAIAIDHTTFDTAYVSETLAANHPEGLTVIFWIYMDDISSVYTSGSAAYQVSRMYDLSSNVQATFQLYPDASSPFNWTRINCEYYNDAGSQFAGYDTVTPTVATWYECRYYTKPATGPGNNDGVFKVWFNGSLLKNLTTVDSDTKAGVGIVRVGAVGYSWTNEARTVYMDDIEIWTGEVGP